MNHWARRAINKSREKMNIYKLDSKRDFINIVVRFVSERFHGSFDKVKILLPSGVLCSKMQEAFIKSRGATILPTIQTFSQLTAESHEAFKVPSSSFGTLDHIEEKIILGDIISAYEGLDYNLINSIKFAPKLSHLFYELESNNIQIDDLEGIAGLQLAEHWENIHNFIKYSYQEWHKILSMRNVASRARYDQEMFGSEIARLKANKDEVIITAGVVGTNKQNTQFLRELANLPSGYVILPPCPGVMSSGQNKDNIYKNLSNNNDIGPNHAFFFINQFVQEICKEGQILHNMPIPENTILDRDDARHQAKTQLLNHFINSDGNVSNLNGINKKIEQKGDSNFQYDPVRYVKFEDVFDEADFIADTCLKIISESQKDSIAIIIPNDQNKKIYIDSLDKHNLIYDDLTGEDVVSNPAISLFMDLANFLCRTFNIKYFFKLLSNPEIFQNEESTKNVVLLKNIILKKNRFVSNLQQIEELLESEKNEDEQRDLQSWFKEIRELFDQIKHNRFNDILREVIERLELLNPSIWSKYEDLKIAETISEIYGYGWQKPISKIEDFPELFKSFISGAKSFSSKEISAKSNITIAKASDTSLINYDHVFLVDFREGNYPPRKVENPWLNKQMQEELSLSFAARVIISNLYNLYLNLHSDNIYISWSQKQLSSSELLESSVINRLKLVAGNKFIKEYIPLRDLSIQNTDMKILGPDIKEGNNSIKEYAHNLSFPKQISATDIETLIRAPYNFYAKKILGLKSLNKLDDYPTLAEFGNCFHEVAEIFTKDYNKYKEAPFKAKKEAFDAIASEIISKAKIPDVTKNIWQIKLNALAPDFIDFENNRQKRSSHVMVEKKGTLKLSIAGKEVNIIAIADRIEIDNQNENKCRILDYKTGAVPTKSDVSSGLSPQLIVESIIMSEGGFDGIKRDVSSITYVKIASTPPYINTTKISLNKDEIHLHKQGLIKLLSHYITHGNYSLEPANIVYDDYSYLAKR